jgi:hypothetical protein
LAPNVHPQGPRVFRIPYTRVKLSPHTDTAPMVHARLWWRGEPTLVDMMMDTGATLTLLPPWLAKVLDLDLGPPGPPGKGIGGSVDLRPSKVVFQLATKDTHGHEGRARELWPVMVASSDEAVPVPLLGRRPFLLHHELIVNETAGEFVLRELPE